MVLPQRAEYQIAVYARAKIAMILRSGAMTQKLAFSFSSPSNFAHAGTSIQPRS